MLSGMSASPAVSPAASPAAPAPALATEAGPRPFKIPESVLVVIHTPDLQVLMLERADRPGFWQCVTGSKDSPDEALDATARREVQEETGIEVGSPAVPQAALRDWALANVYDIYPVWRHRYAPGVTRNTEHVFGLTVPAGTAVRLAPREHLQYRWLPWREAADLCFSPSNAEAILHLARFQDAGARDRLDEETR
jgi:dihydroneopterin triphosphate diphosphatase